MPHSDAELGELINSIVRGEIEKFRKIVEIYQNPVFNFVYRFTGDREEAKDIAQEVFFRVYKNLPQYNSAYKFSSWLFRIAANVSLNHLRKKRPISLPFEDGLLKGTVSARGSPEELYEKQETVSQVQEAISLLPEKYRLVLILRYINEFSCQEIADTLLTNVKSVETILYRGRKLLAASLLKNNFAFTRYQP